MAHPETTIEVGSDTIEVTASEVRGEDRDRLFATQAERSPPFAEYQQKTERAIPVVVLSPR
jgi:deazaflavin-dependent oxidoreductase (nitroreductase family)